MTDDRIVRMLRVSESDPVQQEAADEIERLRAELAAAREALAFYAQHSTYTTNTVYMSGARAETAIERDGGERARKALRR